MLEKRREGSREIHSLKRSEKEVNLRLTSKILVVVDIIEGRALSISPIPHFPAVAAQRLYQEDRLLISVDNFPRKVRKTPFTTLISALTVATDSTMCLGLCLGLCLGSYILGSHESQSKYL